jgi:two-component system, OmpR family, sensor histidine kinase CiaH
MIKKILPKQKLALATSAYWFMLSYIVAALIWWFVSLMNQSRQMTNYKLVELKADDPAYITKVETIRGEEKRATTKYVGEGATFLLLIGLSAVFVYRAVRKQIKMASQQQNFMMAITHELKTPIAIAKLNLETLQKHKLDEQKQQKLINMTLQETDRLNTLTNNILISAQLEGGGYKIAKELIDFSTLTENCIKEYIQRFNEHSWRVNIMPAITIMGDTLLLQMLINNLVDNAVKYGARHGEVNIVLQQINNKPQLQVKDNGPGIANEEKQKIFNRFYRIGNEAVRKTKGTGLGLYLCKKIAADHNAAITVTDNKPTGAIFTIDFFV